MKKTFLALSILTIVLYACKASQDHLTAESIFDEIGRIVEEGLQANGKSQACPSYSLLNDNTLIIDFGSTNCLHNGKLRKGKINITYTGNYRDSLSVITTTFDNYHVNDKLIQGERIVTNQGGNNSGNLWFTIVVNNASITTTNGTINWESNRIREWVNGQNTYNIDDDRYQITGSANGNGVNGNAFTMTILDPLNVDLGCLSSSSCIIKSGTAKISPTGYADRIINYGDSLCDCNVDVIINGTTYPLVIGN
jgi:hypothetical protein